MAASSILKDLTFAEPNLTYLLSHFPTCYMQLYAHVTTKFILTQENRKQRVYLRQHTLSLASMQHLQNSTTTLSPSCCHLRDAAHSKFSDKFNPHHSSEHALEAYAWCRYFKDANIQ